MKSINVCIALSISIFFLQSTTMNGRSMHNNEIANIRYVTIIGAGPAGLLTAYRLKQAGIPVRLYEARSRVGGRIFSDAEHMIEFGPWSLGVVVTLSIWNHSLVSSA